MWEGHRVGRQKAYCHLERLTNLDKLPLTGGLAWSLIYSMCGLLLFGLVYSNFIRRQPQGHQ